MPWTATKKAISIALMARWFVIIVLSQNALWLMEAEAGGVSESQNHACSTIPPNYSVARKKHKRLCPCPQDAARPQPVCSDLSAKPVCPPFSPPINQCLYRQNFNFSLAKRSVRPKPPTSRCKNTPRPLKMTKTAISVSPARFPAERTVGSRPPANPARVLDTDIPAKAKLHMYKESIRRALRQSLTLQSPLTQRPSLNAPSTRHRLQLPPP